MTTSDWLNRQRGTCPYCLERCRLNDKHRTLSHSVPRIVYKDGRGCSGRGLVALEYRKVQYRGFTYRQVLRALTEENNNERPSTRGDRP